MKISEYVLSFSVSPEQKFSVAALKEISFIVKYTNLVCVI